MNCQLLLECLGCWHVAVNKNACMGNYLIILTLG